MTLPLSLWFTPPWIHLFLVLLLGVKRPLLLLLCLFTRFRGGGNLVSLSTSIRENPVSPSPSFGNDLNISLSSSPLFNRSPDDTSSPDQPLDVPLLPVVSGDFINSSLDCFPPLKVYDVHNPPPSDIFPLSVSHTTNVSICKPNKTSMGNMRGSKTPFANSLL